jgi:hypothetical protein
LTGALADASKMVAQPGWLTAHDDLKWLELSIQKLSTPGDNRFLHSFVRTTERLAATGDVENCHVVRSGARAKLRHALTDGLKVYPVLDG